MEELIKKIETIRTDRLEYNLKIPASIEESEIENLKKEFKNKFEIEMDIEFLDFLKICNGLTENGFQIYSSNNHTIRKVLYGIFENNELFYDQDIKDEIYILFATSGQDLFVFNKESKKYELLDRYCGDLMKTYNSFNDMLLYILKLMLYEEV